MQDEVIFGRKSQGKSTISFYRAKQQSRDIIMWDSCIQYPIFPAAHAFDSAVWKCKRRPLCVIVDEASELQTTSAMEPSLSRLVRQGHRYGIAVIQNTHRPPDVHRRSWALASIYIFFRTTDELDLERIEEHCGEEVAMAVSNLARFHCVVWNEDRQTFEVWTDPSKWYVDIHGEHQDKERPIAPPNLTAEEQEQVSG